MNRKLNFLIFIFIISSTIIAQDNTQLEKYRNEPIGDKTFRKKGIMDGNLIRTIFRNDGEIGSWPDRPSGEWPKGSGHDYIDGCTPIVTTPVKAPGNGQTIHPVEGSYREQVDYDPVTGTLWDNEPVPGYSNPSSEEPAISTKPATWPEMWPRVLPNITSAWDGYWYGYFGRGVQNADFETFYVMDDSQDKEFYRPPYSYIPIASHLDRGGLGLRMEVRGFQWSDVHAEDIIFWHYDIVNLADNDYDSTYFGFYCDTGVGGVDDNGDDNANYDKKLDIAYAYDHDGKAGNPSWKTGYVGYAFLESPGNGFNGIDDDDDGMIDERRDDNIDNNHNWTPYTDLNSNGEWDSGEPLNDDLGKDGVGPFDIQYNGPDEGEGDGLPTHGEPNFDETDKDESDQIGLTSLAIERLSNTGPTAIWPKNDEAVYQHMVDGRFDTTIQNANIQILFGSGPFPLKSGLRERFSVALVFGVDYEDMVYNKETVQQIYNANYNFSQPPLKSTLHAVAGDRKVFLYWDSKSEASYDRFLKKFDFEGYMIYRSEEPEFQDIKVITDSKGIPLLYKPIAQFDVKDGIKGSDPIGINGAHFYRGDDTGLQHSFVDTTVTNGQTYYYACVAYDQGDPNYGTTGLTPTPTTSIIQQDLVGNIRFVDINCQIVVPNAPAAGYLPPEITGDYTKVTSGLGTGNINVTLLDGTQIKNGANYKVLFKSEGDSLDFKTTSYSIVRNYNSANDTIVADVDSSSFGSGKFSEPFDGLAISINNYDSVTVNINKTGWIKGFSNYLMPVAVDASNPSRDVAWPADYQIEFLADKSVITPFFKIPVNFKVTNITAGREVQADVFDNNNDKEFDLGDDIILIEYVGNQYKLTWRIGWVADPSAPFSFPPSAGDIFQLSTNKPFKTGDYFTFTTKAPEVNADTARNDLRNVGVVPNPYISTDKWEIRNLNQTGRGERRIDFVNLPANCTVRVYTITGALIKTLYKDSSPTDGALSWDLITDDGIDIAYGIYVYHVDAPGIGEKIGKFAIIK